VVGEGIVSAADARQTNFPAVNSSQLFQAAEHGVPVRTNQVDRSSALRPLTPRQRLRSLRPPTGQLPVVERTGSAWSVADVCNRFRRLTASSAWPNVGPASGSRFSSRENMPGDNSCAERSRSCRLDRRKTLESRYPVSPRDAAGPRLDQLASLAEEKPARIIAITTTRALTRSSIPGSPSAIRRILHGRQTLRSRATRTANNGMKATR